MKDITEEKKYRRRLILPCLLIILIIPLIFVLLATQTNLFKGNTIITSIAYLLGRYIFPLILMPIAIYFFAKQKSKKRVRKLIFINITIGITRLIIKRILHTNQELHLIIAFMINVYGRLNLEKTGKLFSNNNLNKK